MAAKRKKPLVARTLSTAVERLAKMPLTEEARRKRMPPQPPKTPRTPR